VVTLDQSAPSAGESIAAREGNKGPSIMTATTTACAVAVALLAGTASFAAPATAQNAPSSPHAKRLFMSVYDAGLRRGTADSSRSAYLRGFRDGTSSEAYSSRGYLVDSYTGYPAASAPAQVYSAPVYSAPVYSAPVYSYSAPAYSSYSRDAVYAPATGGYYDSYDGRSVSYSGGYGARSVSYGYGNGYGDRQYNSGYAPRGLMDVAVAPLAITPTWVTTPSLDARAAHLNYCAARYQSFDPASGTFLADDGYRYYCR
jgi:hypothetical protein